MFIIVPKRANRTVRHGENGAAAAPVEDGKGPVRTTTACDSCRAKKTKCNGQQPCGPCKRKRIICVYASPAPRDMSVSVAQVSLLDHQQRRLSAAVQKMASVIAKYEDGVNQPPSAFDVIEQLEKYAPQVTVDEEQTPTSETGCSRLSKRKRGDDTTASASLYSTTGGLGSTPELDIPFEIQPNPSYGGNPEESQDAYEAMMQLIRSMNHGQNAPVDAGSMPSYQSSNKEYEVPYFAPATSSSQELLPVDFMKIVDWDASLQNLQNSQHFLFDNQDLPLGIDECFDQLVPGDSSLFDENGTHSQ